MFISVQNSNKLGLSPADSVQSMKGEKGKIPIPISNYQSIKMNVKDTNDKPMTIMTRSATYGIRDRRESTNGKSSLTSMSDQVMSLCLALFPGPTRLKMRG